MMAYLLLLLRGGDMSSLPTYDLYEKNKEFIKWGAHRCIIEVNSTRRHRKQLAYAAQLIKILDLKEPDKNEITNPSNEYQNSSGPSASMNGLGKELIKQMQRLSRLGDERMPEHPTKDSEKDILDEELKDEDNSISQKEMFSIARGLSKVESKDFSKKSVIDYLNK